MMTLSPRVERLVAEIPLRTQVLHSAAGQYLAGDVGRLGHYFAVFEDKLHQPRQRHTLDRVNASLTQFRMCLSLFDERVEGVDPHLMFDCPHEVVEAEYAAAAGRMLRKRPLTAVIVLDAGMRLVLGW